MHTKCDFVIKPVMPAFDIVWMDCAIIPEKFALLKHRQKVNHWPGTYLLARKNCLARNLYRMQQLFGKKEYGFFPETFVIPSELNSLKNYISVNKCKFTFIVKPEAGTQGKGI